MSQLLDNVPDVDIDDNGRFKYILINVQDKVNKASKQIVRGYARAQWHGEFIKTHIHNIFYYIMDIILEYLTFYYVNAVLNVNARLNENESIAYQSNSITNYRI